MVFSGNELGDNEISQLLQDVTELFGKNQKFVNPSEQEWSAPSEPGSLEIQAPIKGTFYNSGNFSMSATDARHPNGHMGVDMRAPAGTPIFPMAPGVVTNVGTNPKGGNTVNIQHASGLRTYYAHMASVRVHKGDRVDNNTVIGTVGTSGDAKNTWPHLHLQVWKNDQIQNPARYFSMPAYSAVDHSKEKWWASQDAKSEAASFNMKQHLADRRLAFERDVDKLHKIATAYYKLAIKAL